MSSSTKYPVAIQAKLPLVASERSKQPFRAPKRKLEEEILEEESTEENVCSLYSQPSPESSHVTETREESTDATVSSQGVKESNQPINSRQVHVRMKRAWANNYIALVIKFYLNWANFELVHFRCILKAQSN